MRSEAVPDIQWPLPETDLPAASRPLVVQSDGTLLLDVQMGEWSAAARNALCAFAQLERSPEYIHTYRITPLSLWNAAAAGVTVEWIDTVLQRFSRYPVPELVREQVREQMQRFGRATLLPWSSDHLLLRIDDPMVRLELESSDELASHWAASRDEGLLVPVGARGALKQALVRAGYPAEDLCGYVDGVPLSIGLSPTTRDGRHFALRSYQEDAVETFHQGGGPRGGAGVIVLPCGAGKTVIGIGAIARLRTSTLILATNTVAVHQWRDEILDETDLAPELIGEYTGDQKQIRPVTIGTYQILTHRQSRDDELKHLDLLRQQQWGLIIYDEVHMLPAPVGRTVSSIFQFPLETSAWSGSRLGARGNRSVSSTAAVGRHSLTQCSSVRQSPRLGVTNPP